MANTILLKARVEEYVRRELAREHGISFNSRFLRLITGGQHEFDAVSADERIVASIKSASGKTRGGNLPAGKMCAAEAELYYLTLVRADVRLLVLTTPEFYAIVARRLQGRLDPRLTLKLVPLPDGLQSEVKQVQEVASQELRT